MEIITSTHAQEEITLKHFTISSKELSAELADFSKSADDFKLIIGRSFDSRYIKLTSIEDLEEHKAKVSVPFSFTAHSTTLNVESHGVKIEYPLGKEPFARDLAKRFSAYVPWYAYLLNVWTFIILMVASTIVSILVAAKLSEQWNNLTWLCPIAVAILSAFIDTKLDRTKIVHRNGRTFFEKNRDIFVVILTIVLTLTAQHFYTTYVAPETISKTESKEPK